VRSVLSSRDPLTVAEDTLIEAIESSLQVYPPVSGLSEDLAIKGVRGRVTDLSHPLANLVGMADIASDDVEATLKMVRNRYSRGRKAYGWVTGPLTRPHDLGEHLVASGLAKADEMAGMVLTDLTVPIAVDPKIEIREATLHEAQAASEMMGRAYGMPEEVARFFNVLLAMTDSKVQNRGYFAYLDGVAEPVAWSYLVYLPDSPIVLLGGAATVPEHRGRGIYSALVAKRLTDARADGRTAAVIQAVRSTSAPIAAKLGFREICGLEFYAWEGAPHQDIPMLQLED
jgi:GNAT superfamily N-acetyltransferase